MEILSHTNNIQDRPGVAILILHNVDYKIHFFYSRQEEHYILIKLSTLQEDTAVINTCALNRASKYVQQTLKELNEEINSSIK